MSEHNRRSIRLKEYDYSQPGAYFVTICVHGFKNILGSIANGEVRLNKYGRVIRDEWLRTMELRPNVLMDEYVVMPNHFHGIIMIIDDTTVGATRRVAPTTTTKPTTLKSNAIGSIIGQIKSASTKRIRKMGLEYFRWQRNYYEHVIRNEDKLHKIRQYIHTNPLKWHLDRENPERVGINKLENEIFQMEIEQK
ncbi:MAG: transposase [candidate division Zixibacteria bacterium]|nr:transposase [candidate division Zixibacteria bacterium]